MDLFGLFDILLNAVCNQIHKVPEPIDHHKFVENLKQKFSSVFGSTLGRCTKTTATLRLKPVAQPVFRPKRPVPYAALTLVEKELDRLVESGVLTNVSYSKWATPIVLTKKLNGSVRVCADFATNLFALIERIKEWGFGIRFEKCHFLMTQLIYLGFVVDAEGRRPIKEKVEAIRDMPEPHDVSTVRSFLGMINYYSQFVKEMRSLRCPLDKLLVKDAKFEWNDDCRNAFNRAKEILLSDLLLTHFDPKADIKVAADASMDGIGAVILHRYPDGSEKAIEHVSRALTPAEKNYGQIEKEALSLVFACKKFHKMIWSRKFILQTDHKPLLAIFGSKKGIPVHASSRLQRWSCSLMPYDFIVINRKSPNDE